MILNLLQLFCLSLRLWAQHRLSFLTQWKNYVPLQSSEIYGASIRCDIEGCKNELVMDPVLKQLTALKEMRQLSQQLQVKCEVLWLLKRGESNSSCEDQGWLCERA